MESGETGGCHLRGGGHSSIGQASPFSRHPGIFGGSARADAVVPVAFLIFVLWFGDHLLFWDYPRALYAVVFWWGCAEVMGDARDCSAGADDWLSKTPTYLPVD